ncbi:MAG: choice-of-anchor D domain-containing protein, partial [bacterium]
MSGCPWTTSAHPRRTTVRRSASRAVGGLLVLVALLAGGPAASQPITFSIAGDHPYGEDEVPEFQEHMDLHDLYSPSEFRVPVGDIKDGSSPCRAARYVTIANILKSLSVPAFIVPGDNEWTDCAFPDSAWTWWEQNLLGIDQSFCGAFAVERQAVRPENFAFVRSGVLFVGINIPNGDVGDQHVRLDDDAAWVDFQFEDKGSQVRAAVVFGQAGPSSARNRFFDPFRVSAAGFAKPVLYAMGDLHDWQLDRPWPEQNIQRVIVENGHDEPPVQVTVTQDPLNPFVFVRNPWSAPPVPFDRPPCVEVGPDRAIVVTDVLSLSARVSDDGDGGPPALAWTKVSGPGGVVFGSPTQAATTAAFTVSGLHVLRLSANDGVSTSSDELFVDVLPDPTEPAPLLSIDDVTLAEGSSGSTTASFTVTRTGGTQTTVTVHYATANGSATAPGDYAATSGELTFAANELSRTIAVPVVADTDLEPNETFSVNLSNPTNGAIIARGQGFATLVNDDVLLRHLAVTVTGTGSVTLDPPGGSYPDGSTVTLRAEMPAGSLFAGWSGDLSGVANPATLLMNADKSVQATFVPNRPPVATADGFTMSEDGSLVTAAPGVLANDSDVDGHPLQALPGTAPAHGVLDLRQDGSFTYSPGPNYFGTDSFAYIASDGHAGLDTASVSIVVSPVNDAPVGAPDAWTTPEETPLSVGPPGVLANDLDVEGSPLSAVPARPPGQGLLSLSPNGSFTYVPNVTWWGRDTFTYRVSDGARTSEEVEVVVTVGTTTSFTFTPTEDSYVRLGSTDNYGSTGDVRIRGGGSGYAAYLKFAPSAIGEIVSAKLRLYVTNEGPDGGTLHETRLEFAGTATPWNEDDLHAGNAPQVVGGSLGSAGAVTLDEWVEWNVSPAVEAVGEVSFGLTADQEANVRYSSKEGPRSPELVVQAFRGVPDVAVQPTSHNFGNVNIASAASASIVVRNEGVGNLTVGATLLGPHVSDFSIAPGDESFVVAPGGARTIAVSLEPSAAGMRTGTLRLATDDPDEPVVNVGLAGNGVDPEIAALPASLNWGDTPAGTTSARTVQIRNDGTGDLRVSATSVDGPAAAEFAIASGGGAFTLAPGQARAIALVFAPTPGIRAAVLRVASDDRDESVLAVPLSGRGLGSRIDVFPASLDFGDVRVGVASPAVVEIRNVGTYTLTVSNLALEGADAADFALAAPGNLVVAPGGTARVDVSFRPGSTGPKAAALRITSDAYEGPGVVPLAGRGVVPDVTVPASQDWGDVRVAESAARTLEVRNEGAGALAVGTSTLVGPDAGEFEIVAGGGPFTLAPGGVHGIEVSFAPTGSGPRDALLRIASDDPDEGVAEVPLAGNGIEPNIVLVEPGHDWGEVRVATASLHALEVRNEGTAPLAVSA